ncbi:MAG: HAMP domain-containing histidine kinase [Gammaproteobacteria bacterium]|nr:HAMP domain-containing histidine kinase [Gammaproteobacteria bacterium]
MPNTLYAKLSLGLVILLIAIGLLYAFISNTITRNYLQEVNQQFNRNLARDLVADRNLVAEGRIDQQALSETFRQYMVINPSIEIYLIDLEGNILSYSADPGKVKRKRVSLVPIKSFLAMDERYPLLGDDPRSHDGKKAFSVTPVPNQKRPEGYLYVVLRGQQIDRVEQMIRESYFLRMSGWAVAASLGVGLVVGLVAFRLLTRRLQRLSAVMEEFEQSRFDSERTYGVDAGRSVDEVDRLGITFDRMAHRIREQIEQLREQDALRRQLVAQVSHDLRTPLASMQGYLETLEIKGQELPEEQRADFLRTALKQGQRLSRMIEELFELASLDAREKAAVLEPFALAELVQDVVQKYRLRTEQREIALELVTAPDLPFAKGDIGMTERVLDNLLDNALAHTPDGGRIVVKLSVDQRRLLVAVTDSGKGIAKDDLLAVFEPFFRADAAPADGSHAGLGLAIAQRIMTLQNGVIWAENASQKGATFSFALPLAPG